MLFLALKYTDFLQHSEAIDDSHILNNSTYSTANLPIGNLATIPKNKNPDKDKVASDKQQQNKNKKGI